MSSVAHLYRIENLKTGEYYIGKHKGESQKKGRNLLYWGSGTRIKNQIKKYGTKNFKYEILVISNTDYIFDLEKKYVTVELLQDELCLNLATGGEGGNTLSEDTIQLMKRKATGRLHSAETKNKLKQIRLNQVFPENHYNNVGKTISSLVWMNDGIKSYRVRPEKVEEKKTEGLFEGRLMTYIDDKYREQSKQSAIRQWRKVKNLGE